MPRLVFKEVSGNWHTNDFKNVSLVKITFDTSPGHALAYVFFGHVNMDFDGSSTAYGPARLNPDDSLKNAGNATQGYYAVYALSPNDPLVRRGHVTIDRGAPNFQGKFPVVQRKENFDPHPGYYVSTTPRSADPKRPYKQSSYVDSAEIAYGALDGRLKALGVDMGDFGLALRHDQNMQSGFYFVDAGKNKYALGECSHKVGKNLGVTRLPNGKYDNNFPVSFILFPGSRKLRPQLFQSLKDAEIEKAMRPRLVELARAENADELPLLMGFNEVRGGVPQGKKKLDAYLKKPGSPKPSSYATIKLGLVTFGFQPSATPTRPPEIF